MHSKVKNEANTYELKFTPAYALDSSFLFETTFLRYDGL
jgi:hypothetical protein